MGKIRRDLENRMKQRGPADCLFAIPQMVYSGHIRRNPARNYGLQLPARVGKRWELDWISVAGN